MVTKISSALIAQEGKYLIIPPWKEGQEGWGNTAIPAVHTAGGNTVQQYPTNTKFVDFDRTFIYGYVSAKANAAVKSNVGLFNNNTPINTCTWGAAAGAAGDTRCPFLTSDLTGYTTATVNLFAGGYMMPRSDNPYGSYRIVSNTVFNGGVVATETDLTIEDGLGAAVAASSAYCYISKNPYTAMKSEWLGTNTYGSVVGVTLIDPTASTYQWVQTWGPIFMLGGEQAGATTYCREQYFHQDGTLVAVAQGDHTATVQRQTAGYCIEYTFVASAGVYGALTQLQLER